MNIHELDAIEKDSIRGFLERACGDGTVRGRILDYGCGKQPYRELLQGAGEYTPWDRKQLRGNVSGGDVGDWFLNGDFDTVVSTQVIQYVQSGYQWLRHIRDTLMVPGGHLVMTYPTTWPEIRDDLHRYTRLGMEQMLAAAAFTVIRHEQRAVLPFDGFELALGYGVIARAGQ